ncbi:MAG: hypothetical protein M1826_002399 [Phylliscum demangeonii]|nr:MAG: hypothetical protein M1826_002399 [Phylliscum demangeonii]
MTTVLSALLLCLLLWSPASCAQPVSSVLVPLPRPRPAPPHSPLIKRSHGPSDSPGSGPPGNRPAAAPPPNLRALVEHYTVPEWIPLIEHYWTQSPADVPAWGTDFQSCAENWLLWFDDHGLTQPTWIYYQIARCDAHHGKPRFGKAYWESEWARMEAAGAGDERAALPNRGRDVYDCVDQHMEWLAARFDLDERRLSAVQTRCRKLWRKRAFSNRDLFGSLRGWLHTKEDTVARQVEVARRAARSKRGEPDAGSPSAPPSPPLQMVRLSTPLRLRRPSSSSSSSSSSSRLGWTPRAWGRAAAAVVRAAEAQAEATGARLAHVLSRWPAAARHRTDSSSGGYSYFPASRSTPRPGPAAAAAAAVAGEGL